MKRAWMVAALLACASCTDEPGARRALTAAGYSAIELTGYASFSCGKDDVYATAFRAVGPTGVHVTGAVCSAAFKGHTIRID